MQSILMNLWTWCILRRALLLWIVLATWTGGNAQTPGGVGHNLYTWYTMDSIPNGPVLTNPLRNVVPMGLPGHTTGDATYQTVGQNHYQARSTEIINNHQSIYMDDEWFQCPLNINRSTTNSTVGPFFDNLHIITVYKTRQGGTRHLWGNGARGDYGRQATTTLYY